MCQRQLLHARRKLPAHVHACRRMHMHARAGSTVHKTRMDLQLRLVLRAVHGPRSYLKTLGKPPGIPRLIHMTMRDKHKLAPHQILSMLSWGRFNRGYVLLLYDNDDITAYMARYYPAFMPSAAHRLAALTDSLDRLPCPLQHARQQPCAIAPTLPACRPACRRCCPAPRTCRHNRHRTVYNQLKTPVEKSDAWRYHVLCGHGGVYADTDTICARPFDEWLNTSSSGGGGSDGSLPEPGLVVGVENRFHSQALAEEASYVHKIQITQW